MDIVIQTNGNLRMIYHEGIDPHALGITTIRRGSHVEPTVDGFWTADLAPVGGPCLGPFESRSVALAAEIDWLREHWLIPTGDFNGSPNINSMRCDRRTGSIPLTLGTES